MQTSTGPAPAAHTKTDPKETTSAYPELIDYGHDGWPDIYFTNAQNVNMALNGGKAHSALYYNNHDGILPKQRRQAGSADHQRRAA